MRVAPALLCLTLSLLACRPSRPALIGDGFYLGEAGAYARRFHDSLLALEFGDAVRIVGLPDPSTGDDTLPGAPGWMTGRLWARRLLGLGNLTVVVGHPGSGATNDAALVYAARGVPLIVPNATAEGAPDVETWLFRLLPDDRTQGQLLADHALDSLAARRIAVVFVGDRYGSGVLHGVESRLVARATPIVDRVEMPSSPCDDGPTGLATRLVARAMVERAHPDAVILVIPPDPARCVIEEVQQWAPRAWIIGSDALDTPDLRAWSRRRPRADRILIASGWRERDDSASRAFRDAFRTHFGTEPEGRDALIHDGFRLAAIAIVQAGPSPHAVRDWLRRLGGDGTRWTGVSGPISFSGPPTPRLAVRRIQ